MENQFLPYELALKLKDLGFDNKQFLNLAFVSKNNNFYTPQDLVPDSAIWTPLWQQVFDWFKEKYDLFGCFQCPEYDIPTYGYRIYRIGDSEEYSGDLETYEEARLECLKKLIKNLQNGNK